MLYDEKQIIDVESLHLSAINEGCGLLICRNGETFVGGIEGMSSFMNSTVTGRPSPIVPFSSMSLTSIK